jgi:hypothetical protein
MQQPATHCILMTSSLLAFRTISRIFIGRQVQVLGQTVILPIALASTPTEISIDPGDKIEKVMTKACDGREVIDFTYPKGSEPQIELKFGLAVMELESLLHGHVVAPAAGSVEVMVLSEFNTASPPAARSTGTIGTSVTAQTVDSKALASYIDPLTKVAKKLTIEDSTAILVGDQISIGVGMVITVSPEIATKAVDVKAWVPCLIAGATVITATPIGLITIFAQGVNFNGTARLLTARNCSRTESGPIASTPERSFKLSILPDVLSLSQLGWDFYDTGMANAC